MSPECTGDTSRLVLAEVGDGNTETHRAAAAPAEASCPNAWLFDRHLSGLPSGRTERQASWVAIHYTEQSPYQCIQWLQKQILAAVHAFVAYISSFLGKNHVVAFVSHSFVINALPHP